MNEETQHTESGNSPPRKRQLSKLARIPGETREVILSHEEAGGRLATRLVRIEGGGVDRDTGKPLKVWYETTVKVPREPEVTRTFTGQGDPLKAEWNARITYLAAQHRIADLARSWVSVGEVGRPVPRRTKQQSSGLMLQ